MGCCRRVPGVPEDLVVGKSRVFLCNREGVFAYYVVRGLAYVTRPDVDLDEELARRGVKPVRVEQARLIPRRGCGYLQVGGFYLLSEEDMERVADLAASSMLEGRITLIRPPVPYHGGAFRGIRYVHGNRILARRPEHTWFVSEAWRRAAKKHIKQRLRGR